MERKIGEVFVHNNVLLKTVEGYNCWGCYMFRHGGCFDVENHGDCSKNFRTDKKGVIFKLIDMCKNKEEKRNVELTIEKAREWYKQGGELKEVALQAFSESELKDNRSHTWEEFCENHCRKEGGYFIGTDSIIQNTKNYCEGHFLNPNYDRNNYPTKEYAEAALALSQLLQLRQEWIGDWKPDWNDYSLKYTIVYCSNKPQCSNSIFKHEVLSFPDLQMALEFLDDFKDLLEIAKSFL